MGEEAGGYDFDFGGGGGGYGGYDGRVTEWETGLPGCDELTPLSQPLVPPGLAAAFRIPPEPGRTLLDVHRASSATVSRLRSASSSPSSGNGHAAGANGRSFPSFPGKAAAAAAAAAGEDSGNRDNNSADSGGDKSSAAAAATKRARLVWTPQLHKRFVEVVAHLGIKSAVPKTIMQLMNVEGLTRENVASHLQKYRLYVKRMQGLSNEGPSASDHIFASTPVPPSLREPQVPVPHAAAMAPAMYHHHPAPMGGVAAGHGGYYQQQHSGHAVYNGYGGHGGGGGVSSYPHYHHGDQ